MKIGNQLKPQDVFVLLKLLTWQSSKPWRYGELAIALGVSQSEVHSAIKRAEFAGLYDPLTRRPIRANFTEFLISGIRYIFPARAGKISVGVPTAHSMSPLKNKIVSGKTDTYVWPSRMGKTKGLAVEPLYPAVPGACIRDPKLHELFALVDALRLGRAREKELAKELLTERLATA